MMDLLTIAIFIGIGYGLYKLFHKTKYRIIMTDPLTGYRRYLSSVDGISNSFNYTSSPAGALIFYDIVTAERFINGVDQQVHPTIQIKSFFSWKQVNHA